jgi:hypothetical protein
LHKRVKHFLCGYCATGTQIIFKKSTTGAALVPLLSFHLHPQPFNCLGVNVTVHGVNKIIGMNNHSVVVDTMAQLTYVSIPSPSFGDNFGSWQDMAAYNMLQGWRVPLCHNLQPATTTTAFNQSNHPLTTAKLITMIFPVEKINIVNFNYH